MSPQSLPAITFDQSIDDEYVITATHRVTGAILAVAMGYWVDDVTTRIDLQLLELGYSLYDENEGNIWN
jgi:hypothetical protein